MGLLVAGITGGASLIRSAKERRLIEEINTYTQAYIIFITNNNRIPGDIKNEGKMIRASNWNAGNCVFIANDFPAPYDNSTTGHELPCNFVTGPWIDLYLAGITNFKPQNTNNNTLLHTKLHTVGAIPNSKFDKNMSPYYFYMMEGEDTGWAQNTGGYHFVVFNSDDNGTLYYDPIPFRSIDLKIDDGLALNGKIRGNCGNNNGEYQTTINAGAKCSWMGVVLPY
jgi:hypothetical protein